MAVSKVGDGLQGDAELGDKGLDQEGMGRDDALIGGQGGGGFDGVDTLGDDVGRAHMMVAEEGFEGGAAGELRRFEGRPAAAGSRRRSRCLCPETIAAPAGNSSSGYW